MSSGRRGRRPECPDEVRILILVLRKRGLSLSEIAEALNSANIPTPRNAPHWAKKNVDDVIHTRRTRELTGDEGIADRIANEWS